MSQAESNAYSGCGFLLIAVLAIAGAAWWSGLTPFHRISNRRAAAQAEVKIYVGALNRGQQAFYIEQEKLTANIEALDLGISTETQFFSYRATLLSDWAVQHDGIAKDAAFRSSIGLVWVVPDPTATDGSESDEIAAIPNALLCISEAQTTAMPPEFELPAQPITADTEITCPEGYTEP